MLAQPETDTRRAASTRAKSGGLSPVCDPGPLRATLGLERYFAVVLKACGEPTITASIMSARSRRLAGVP